jgi:hypothetical protein
MGGKGSGGVRAGSGRKPKQLTQKMLEGAASLAERRQHARSLPNVDEFDAPDDLTTDERNVWLALAPGAFKARTLTAATSYAFCLLIRNVLLERELRMDPDKRGAADHRGILQRVEAGLTAFGLRALGKPMVDDAPKVADPFDEFDGVGGTH